MERGLGALQEKARPAVFLRMIGGYILVFRARSSASPGGIEGLKCARFSTRETIHEQVDSRNYGRLVGRYLFCWCDAVCHVTGLGPGGFGKATRWNLDVGFSRQRAPGWHKGPAVWSQSKRFGHLRCERPLCVSSHASWSSQIRGQQP